MIRLLWLGAAIVIATVVGCGDDSGTDSSADTSKPTLNAVMPAHGEQFDTTGYFDITVIATDNEAVTGIRFGESENLSDSSWYPYRQTIRHAFSIDDGTKTVYAQVKDAAGNVSDVVQVSVVRAVSTTVVYFEPHTIDISVGKETAVDLRIVNADALVSGQFRVTFDPATVEIVEVTMNQDSHILGTTDAVLLKDIKIERGEVLIGALAIQDGFMGVYGDGLFATIKIRARTELSDYGALSMSGKAYQYTDTVPSPANCILIDGTMK